MDFISRNLPNLLSYPHRRQHDYIEKICKVCKSRVMKFRDHDFPLNGLQYPDFSCLPGGKINLMERLG